MIFVLMAVSMFSHAQRPVSGTYTYALCYNEHAKCFNTCTVIIKDDSITVYADLDLSVPKGEVIEKGILIQHRSGKWIIGQKPEDINALKIGGCGSRYPIIDFKRKRFWSC
jgi:hypothetical protein